MGLMKIVSGGQTGVDRAALDAALMAGFPCGGGCPAGRLVEDGEIPERYPLTPLPDEFATGKWQRTQVREAGQSQSPDSPAPGEGGTPEESGQMRSMRNVAEGYRARTLKNVQDSDGTVILYSGTLSGGTLLTRNLCVREKKPFVALDARQLTALRAAGAISRFLEEQ